MTVDTDNTLRQNHPTPQQARARLLQMHFTAKVGHIGGNLSALDAMLHLHGEVMGDEDIFVLSKGHAAGALYISLWAIGRLTDHDLTSFHQDNTNLAGHPIAHWHPSIKFATGSLGHGLSLAAGSALAKRLRNEPGIVYCMISDGECEEGSIWEALIFIKHQNLANLVILIDANGLQGFGSTTSVASLEPLTNRFEGFGFTVVEVDGHCTTALNSALVLHGDVPLIIILRTIKGKGVSFMENEMQWHYLPLTNDLYEKALVELGAS